MTHPGSGNPTWQDWPSAQTPISAYALEQIESVLDNMAPGQWQPLVMQNGWANRDASVYYDARCRLVTAGRVEITGTIFKSAGGLNGETVAVLPSGYRPPRELVVPILDSAGRAIGVNIKPAGTMSIYASQATASALTLFGVFPIDGA